MAQLGIENPEDLPTQFRTKQHTFTKSRKSSDSLSTKAQHPLQPAPRCMKRSDTPNSLQNSTPTGTDPNSRAHSYRGPQPITTTHTDGNFPFFPGALSPQPSHAHGDFGNTSPTFAWQNRVPAHGNSPGLMHSPLFRPATPTQSSGAPIEPGMGMFSPDHGQFAASTLRDPSAAENRESMISPGRDHFGRSHSNSAGNMDNLFADFTTDPGEDAARTQAGEALEGLGVNMSSQEDEPSQMSLVDEFFNG